MNVKTAKTIINDCINKKKNIRRNEAMDVFGISPEFVHTVNMNYPQIVASINSIPGATTIVAACAVSLSAFYAAVIKKHYLTRSINELKKIKYELLQYNELNLLTDEKTKKIEKVKNKEFM